MRILLVHNFYQWAGGEDQVFAAEGELLERHGHTVSRYSVHNEQVARLGTVDLARKTLWNSSIHEEIRAACREHAPQIVHFHNTFPLVSPAGYYAARKEGAAVVQTLHNYRLICPGATLYRSGAICEQCVGRSFAWPGVVHGCYRDSRSATAGAAVLAAGHRLAGTWNRAVDRYIAPSEFLRQKYIEGGFHPEKVVHKPNFVPADPGVGEHRGGYGLYVGRLAEEKGIRLLLRACAEAKTKVPLKMVGDGPLASLLQPDPPGVEWLGPQPREQVMRLMQDASFLVFPTQNYEPFGLTIVEAFATGLPVIASAAGAAAELVDHGRTGLHFRSGDAGDLASTLRWAQEHPEELAAFGRAARQEYLDHYTSKRNYELLVEVYNDVLEGSARGGRVDTAVV